MQPTLARAPFHRLGWVSERKEDGWRMFAYKDGRKDPTSAVRDSTPVGCGWLADVAPAGSAVRGSAGLSAPD